MKKFCIITNVDKDDNYDLAEEIKENLEGMECECDILPNILMADGTEKHYTDTGEIKPGTQCAIVLGGDGTMIQAAIDLVECDIPIIGINIGTVGFLTEADRKCTKNVLEKLVSDEYSVENRIMLECNAFDSEGNRINERPMYALNDMVLFKRGSNRLMTADVYSNDELLDSYTADGLIISTPTGSTGYNLSAGGPVMAPHINAAVITPICPHALNKRSVVVDSADRIKAVIGRTKDLNDDMASVILDGRSLCEVSTGGRVEVEVPDNTTRLIKVSGMGFYEKMRIKFSGSLSS